MVNRPILPLAVFCTSHARSLQRCKHPVLPERNPSDANSSGIVNRIAMAASMGLRPCMGAGRDGPDPIASIRSGISARWSVGCENPHIRPTLRGVFLSPSHTPEAFNAASTRSSRKGDPSDANSGGIVISIRDGRQHRFEALYGRRSDGPNPIASIRSGISARWSVGCENPHIPPTLRGVLLSPSHTPEAFNAASTRSSRKGTLRMRTPVAS